MLLFSKIHGDFVLISGDTVSNMPLSQALEKHKETRKKDSLAVLTMVIQESKTSPLTHQTRLGTDELVMAIDPGTNELLYYEDKLDKSKCSITLDKNMLADKSIVHLHNDKHVMAGWSLLLLVILISFMKLVRYDFFFSF